MPSSAAAWLRCAGERGLPLACATDDRKAIPCSRLQADGPLPVSTSLERPSIAQGHLGHLGSPWQNLAGSRNRWQARAPSLPHSAKSHPSGWQEHDHRPCIEGPRSRAPLPLSPLEHAHGIIGHAFDVLHGPLLRLQANIGADAIPTHATMRSQARRSRRRVCPPWSCPSTARSSRSEQEGGTENPRRGLRGPMQAVPPTPAASNQPKAPERSLRPGSTRSKPRWPARIGRRAPRA